MSVRNLPTIEDTNPIRMVSTIRQLAFGRSNGVGSVTLTPNATSTTVVFSNCGEASEIVLSPRTANAAASIATTYISSVGNGSFTISHANSAQTDRTFGFHALG